MSQSFWRSMKSVGIWTMAGAGCGLLLGLAAMFGRVAPFVDSGSSSASLVRYTPWIPIGIAIGTVLGLALGMTALVVAALARWIRR